MDARRRGGVVSTSLECQAYEKDFIGRFGSAFRKHLAFECSMLQILGENEDGKMKWRDLTCQDADDFVQFSTFPTCVSDLVCDDKVALVPSGDEMVWRTPLEMCAFAMGKDVGEKKMATVARVAASTIIEHESSSGVRGRTTSYERRIGDCTRSKVMLRGETVSESVIRSRGGRPKKSKGHNQHRDGKVDALVAFTISW